MKKSDPPLFLWASPLGYDFNDKKILDTKGMEKTQDLQKVSSLTINVVFQVEDQLKGMDGKPLLVEVVGHSECNCWGLLIDYEGISFGKKCE